MQTSVTLFSEQNNWKLISYYLVNEQLNVTLSPWNVKKNEKEVEEWKL